MNKRDQCTCILRMADTCLVLGHRMSELMGHAPILEEDLSIANIALELVDQSRAWLTLAGELEGANRDEDALAYGREQHQFFNATLAEQPNGHFGDTVVRQLLVSAWQREWYRTAKATSGHSTVKALAGKFLPQAEFHWRWASDWTLRLGDGTELSHARMQASLDSLWKFTGELINSDALDRESAASSFTPAPDELSSGFHEEIAKILSDSTLLAPRADTLRWHGKRGEHGEELGLLLAEMQSLNRAHPGVIW